jgi:hypothetical protein
VRVSHMTLLAVHRQRRGRVASSHDDGAGPAKHDANARARQTAQRAREHINSAGEDVRHVLSACI